MGDAKGIQYCPLCGEEVNYRRIDGRIRPVCQSCERTHYRNPKPCAGVLVSDGERVLLVKRTEPPDVGAWSVPAGYLERDESPRAAAARELSEETGLRVSQNALTLHDTVFVQHPSGQHVLVLVYRVTASATDGDVVAGSDAAAARYWRLSHIETTDEQIETGYKPVIEAAVAQT